MKQIIMLEKAELNILKGGETLTLSLPSGESVQIGLDGGFRKRNVAEPDAGNHKTRPEMALEVFRKNPGTWIPSSAIKDALGSWQGVTAALSSLHRRKLLEKKSAGTKTPNGKMKLLYRLTKRGVSQ